MKKQSYYSQKARQKNQKNRDICCNVCEFAKQVTVQDLSLLCLPYILIIGFLGKRCNYGFNGQVSDEYDPKHIHQPVKSHHFHNNKCATQQRCQQCFRTD